MDIATLDKAAALPIATSTPVTEAGRYIQWALYLVIEMAYLGVPLKILSKDEFFLEFLQIGVRWL